MLRAFASVALSVVLCLVAGCGGSGSPTAPTLTPTLLVESFSASAQQSGTSIIYTANFVMHETGGRLGATVAAADFVFLTTGTRVASAHADSPLVTSKVAAGASVASANIRVTDSTPAATLPTSLVVTVSYTDDNGRTGSVTGTAAITPPPTPAPAPAPAATATLFGVLSDNATSRAISGATVAITAGTSVGKAATTDGNGYYSIPGIAVGSITVQVTAAGYTTLTQTINLTGDLRQDLKATAPVSSPGPTPSPSPSGNTCSSSSAPSGTTAICNDGTYSQSQNRSGTCSTHTGVRCWICPGALCSGLSLVNVELPLIPSDGEEQQSWVR